MTDAVAPVHSVTVAGRQWLSADSFVLQCSRPAAFTFEAGQHVVLACERDEREYTLLSAPDAADLRFLIKRVAGGKLSSRLAELAPGAVLGMSQAKGYLTYRSTDRPAVFIATGVGIAPFVSMVAAGRTGFTLIQGARNPSGLFFRQELRAAAVRYIPCVSGIEEAADLPDLYRGRVTGAVKRFLAPERYDVYLCGSRAMITEMLLLLDEHCPEARIYSEAYS